jgi:hypothetical protein
MLIADARPGTWFAPIICAIGKSEMSVVMYSTTRPSTQARLRGKTASVRPTSNTGEAQAESSAMAMAGKMVYRMGDLILAPNSKSNGTPWFDMFANALHSSHPKLDFALADRAKRMGI